MALRDQFAAIFDDPGARAALAAYGRHTRLPTFNLATTSLRPTNKWFDRLDEINRGVIGTHSNFYPDPAAIGLIDRSAAPPVLTQAGQAFVQFRSTIRNNSLRAEYELVKAIYFSQYPQSLSVKKFLAEKQKHLEDFLYQFVPAPTRHLFLEYPKLLVIAELLAGFPGAIRALLALSEDHLVQLERLGEDGFKALCARGGPAGLALLCNKIGSDYGRAQERRLHQIVSMCLLTVAMATPKGRAKKLIVPAPYCNLLTEEDVYRLHDQYTSDINIWFDDVTFQVSASLTVPAGARRAPRPSVRLLNLQPQTRVPSGRANASSSTDQGRQIVRSVKRAPTAVVIDPVISERAESLAEERILRPLYGNRLIRAGHRNGEGMALPDGMVPGADFYVVDASSKPARFIEIKSVTGDAPFDITFTRAEYLRACRCADDKMPYDLILVDVVTGRFYEVRHFAVTLSSLLMREVMQIVFRLVLSPPIAA